VDTDEVHQGQLTEVTVKNVGTETSADHILAATTLNVYDSSDFDDTGGQLMVVDDVGVSYILGYTTKDDDLNTITLATGLPWAAIQDSQVFLYPLSTEKWAQVMIDEDDEPVVARIPYRLSQGVDEGIRMSGQYESVLVKLVGTEFEVDDFPGKEDFLDGTALNPADIPAPPVLTPTAPPASSPDIKSIKGTTTTLIVETEEIEPTTTLNYYISDTPGFTPGSGNLVTTTRSVITVVNQLPDGTPLDPTATYYMRVLAFNSLGNSPTYSPEVGGFIDLTNSDILAIASLVTGFVLTGRIQVGSNIFIDSDEGIKILGAGGVPILWFPPDGANPLQITAQLIAQSLNVQTDLAVSGLGQIYGDIALANGIPNPTSTQKPTLSSTWDTVSTQMANPYASYWGAIEHPTDAAKFATLIVDFGGSNIQYLNKSDGSIATIPDPTDGQSWTVGFYAYGGFCYNSSNGDWYIMGKDILRNSGDWYIYRIDGTTFAKTSEKFLGSASFFGAYNGKIVSDGTNIGYVWVASDRHLYIKWLNSTTYVIVGSVISLMSGLGAQYEVGDVHYGTGLTAASRLWVALANTPTYPKVLVFNPSSSYNRNTPQEFLRANGKIYGLCFDTAGGRFMSYDHTGLLARYGLYTTDVTITGKFAWFDDDVTTSTHETVPGGLQTFVLPCRSYLQTTVPTPPDINNTDPLNTDKADQVVLYLSDDAGTTWHRVIYTGTPGWGSVYSTLVGLATGTPKTTNEFLTSTFQTPGIIRSIAADSGIDSILELIRLKGDGTWRMGNYTNIRHFGCRWMTSAQSIATGGAVNTGTLITFGSALVTTTGMTWDGTNSQWVVAKSGIYHIELSVLWTANSTGRRHIQIWKNGSTLYAGDERDASGMSAGSPTMHCSVDIPCVAGDTISAKAWQNSGSALNINVASGDSSRHYFSCAFVGQ
jgi:hypothetical protein